MKILCLTSELPPQIGGIATHVFELTRRLSDFGNDISVIAPGKGVDFDNGNGIGPTVETRRFLISGKPLFDIQFAIWLRKHIATLRPDVVHVHGMKCLAATATWACASVPVVFTNHTSGFLRQVERSVRSRIRAASRIHHATAIIAPSETLFEATRQIGYAGSLHYVPNGVDTDRFSHDDAARVQLRNDWNVEDGEPVVLLSARLAEIKGASDFAQACGSLSDVRCGIVVAGDGPERAEMERVFAELGLSGRVRFLGAVPNAEMPEVYSAADIAVLPSRMEATSISGLEAMACGLALVGTAVGGIPALVSDGKTGTLVPPQDRQALGTAMRELALDAERRERYGAAAREKAVREFPWTRIAGQTLEILETAAARR